MKEEKTIFGTWSITDLIFESLLLGSELVLPGPLPSKNGTKTEKRWGGHEILNRHVKIQ